MRAMWLSVGAMAAVGCTTVEKTFTESIPASDVATISVDLERGSFSYTGAPTSDILIDGRSYGSAADADRAAERQEGTDYTITLTGAELMLRGSNDAALAGVDFSVVGPPTINTSIVIDNGHVDIEDVSGAVFAVADSISVERLSGPVDLLARSGSIDAELLPRRGADIRVESQSGDITLWLPWGMDYDLQVWGDPNHEMLIEDLGFGWTTSAPGYFAGQAGPASTRIDVYASGGAVYVYSTY